MMSTTLFLWMRVPAVKNQYQSALSELRKARTPVGGQVQQETDAEAGGPPSLRPPRGNPSWGKKKPKAKAGAGAPAEE